MYRKLFIFLFIFLSFQSFGSEAFLRTLESFNDEALSCTRKAGFCASSVSSLRCAFESYKGEATPRGNCSYYNKRSQLVAVYDELAFSLYNKLVNGGVEPHYNGREFKVVVDKVSCRRVDEASSDLEDRFICRIF